MEELIKNKENLQNYLKTENSDILHDVLNKCIKFGESFVQENFLRTKD
jgi:hypothetical protein